MTAVTPELSVVIPVYNGAEWLLAQLQAVSSATTGGIYVEVIVVDNRSTDGSGELARRWGEDAGVDLRVVDAFDRAGEPHARNIGIAAARSDKIAFCDADDVVGTGWIRAMASQLEDNEYVTGPVDCTMLNDPWVAATREASMATSAPMVHGIPFANGCNMGFSRSFLGRLGGFDETFLIGCDIEIAIRAWRVDVQLAWAPEAVVHYRLRSSPSELYRQARLYGRARKRFAELVPDAADHRELRRKRVRRAAWLARHLGDAFDAHGRSKWMWVAGQVVGETESMFDRNV